MRRAIVFSSAHCVIPRREARSFATCTGPRSKNGLAQLALRFPDAARNPFEANNTYLLTMRHGVQRRVRECD